jgi:hypothetical protein
MKWLALALLGPLGACAASAPAPNYAVASKVAAPDVSSASYHTFAFGLAEKPRAGYEVTPRSLDVQRRLRGLVKAALEERQIAETTDHPDLVVKIAAGSGSGFQLRPATSSAVLAGAPERTQPEPAVGFIGIDIYSGATGNQLWQGAAFAEVDPGKIDDALLQRGVAHMLECFASPAPASVAKGP